MTMKDTNKDIITYIKNATEEYRKHTLTTIKVIQHTESMRTRIVNLIEELQHQQLLDKRTASLLEDRLTRPYTKLLF